jgi:hypothetical protein
VRVVTYEDRCWLATIIVDVTTTPAPSSVAIARVTIYKVLVTVLTMVAIVVVAIFTVVRAFHIPTGCAIRRVLVVTGLAIPRPVISAIATPQFFVTIIDSPTIFAVGHFFTSSASETATTTQYRTPRGAIHVVVVK